MHPHIVTHADLTVRMGSKGLVALIYDPESGLTHTFEPPLNRAERTLENALLHIASGITPSRIASHFTEHNLAESSCPCCKLEGRILSGMGRKSPELSRRPISSGTVQIRRIPLGKSADQILADASRAAKRARTLAAMEKALSTPQRRTSVPIEELI